MPRPFKGFRITQPGSNAIPVSNIMLTGASASTLTVSFTAPPSGSIGWNIRQHGTTAWTAANGTFASNTATFTGLIYSTAYDIQALATNNGGTATTELDSLSTSAPVSGGGGNAPSTLTVADFGSSGFLFSREAGATTGNPPGLPTTFNKGYARVPFVITSSAAVSGTNLLMRLRDRDNANTILMDWTATGINALANGANNVPLFIPANTLYIADFGWEGSQNTYASTPRAFGPAYIVLGGGQSIATNLFGTAAGKNNEDFTPYVQPQARTFYMGTGSNGPHGKWIEATDTTSDFYSSSAEGLNLLYAEQGIPVAFLDCSVLGTPIENFDTEGSASFGNTLTSALNAVGLVTGANPSGALYQVVTPGRIDAMWWDGNNSGRDQQIDYYAAVATSLRLTTRALVDKDFDFIYMMQDYNEPAPDARNAYYDAKVDRQIVRKITRAKTSRDRAWLGSSPNGHPGNTYKQYNMRRWYQDSRIVRGASPAAPSIVSASRAVGSADIYLTIANNGTALTSWLASVPNGTELVLTMSQNPSAAALGSLFNLAATGTEDGSSGNLTLIQASSAVIVNATTIKVTFPDTLSGRSFSGDYDYDLIFNGASSPSVYAYPSIRDDILDPGMSYGRSLQGSLSPTYVPKPSAPSASISITSIDGLSSSISVRALALITITGTWVGNLPGIELSLDGASYVAASDLRISTTGTWRATFQAPTVGASHTINARIVGTSVVAGSMSFATVANDIPTNGLIADVDVRLLGSNLYSDVARTTLASDLDRMNGYTDPTGSGAHFAAHSQNVGQRILRDNANGLPVLICQSGYFGYHNSYPAAGYSYVRSTALPALLTSDSFTVFFTVLKPSGGGGSVIAAKAGNGGFALVVGIGNGGFASVLKPDGTKIETDTGVDLSGKIVHAVARFDASAGVIKVKTANDAEVSISGYAGGTRNWASCDLGYGGNSGDTGLRGLLSRAGMVNRLWSDAERDAYLAQSLRRHGV